MDKAHSRLGFTAKHMMFTTVRGNFADYDGYVEVDGDDYSGAKGEFTVKTASIETGVQQRDDHLRSPDFFNAPEFPDLTFRPTSITATGTDVYKVAGDLTIRGFSKPIELDVTVEGKLDKDAWGKQRVAITALGAINRKDWGLNWNMALETGGWLVSDTIKIEVEAAFVAEAASESGAAA
jgi:polyisoprenoid-binding protein YceI